MPKQQKKRVQRVKSVIKAVGGGKRARRGASKAIKAASTSSAYTTRTSAALMSSPADQQSDTSHDLGGLYALSSLTTMRPSAAMPLASRMPYLVLQKRGTTTSMPTNASTPRRRHLPRSWRSPSLPGSLRTCVCCCSVRSCAPNCK